MGRSRHAAEGRGCTYKFGKFGGKEITSVFADSAFAVY